MVVSQSDDVEPLSYRTVYSKWLTSANSNFQIARAPWAAPVNKRLQLEKVIATNFDGTSGGGTLFLWDQDLSNTTTVGRGSGAIGGALLAYGVGAAGASGVGATTLLVNDSSQTVEVFGAGIAALATRINTFVSVEVDVV